MHKNQHELNHRPFTSAYNDVKYKNNLESWHTEKDDEQAEKDFQDLADRFKEINVKAEFAHVEQKESTTSEPGQVSGCKVESNVLVP